MATTLRQLLIGMEEAGASDLYLHEGRAPAARVHGVVRTLALPPVEHAALQALLEEVLTPVQRAHLDRVGDVDAGWTVDRHRFRLAIGRQQGQLVIVARAVPSGALDLAVLEIGRAHV